MTRPRNMAAVLWMAFALLSVGPVTGARGDSSIQLDSHAFGAGTFGYEVTVRWNAFFNDFYDVHLGIIPFTNLTGLTVNGGGVFPITPHGDLDVYWYGTWPSPETRLVTAWSDATYVSITNVFVLFLAKVAGWPAAPYISGNIAGYIRVPALIPSTEPDTNVTASSISTNVVLVPDPKIVDVTAQSLSIQWYTAATFRVEAQRDAGPWTNVATLLHDAPVTVWTSAVPLGDIGDRFRVALLANEHNTNLLAAPVPASLGAAPVVSAQPAGRGLTAVSVVTEIGRTYEIALQEAAGAPLDRVAIAATAKLTTVILNDRESAGAVLIRAKLLP